MPFVRDRKPDKLKRWAQIIGIIATACGLVFALVSIGVGVWEYLETQSKDAEKTRQTQALEAQKPYLEKKLKWCEEATETASALANNPIGKLPQSEERFEQLYWGVMGMIEDDVVEPAMIAFRNQLRIDTLQNTPLIYEPSGTALQDLALNIAHACRVEMAKEWSPAWKR